MKSYAIDQSVFYRLQNRKKLAKIVGVDVKGMEAFCKSGAASYECFNKDIPNKKSRWVEWPVPDLRKIQKAITSQLRRITPPAYLHSAFRKRSYVTNANVHFDCSKPTCKIDIEKFFPSADDWRVARAFKEQFQCSPDVAAVLMKLTTMGSHIPTGGNSSTMISFWAYKPMFDEINALAEANGLVMTCCVDDMTFTGNKANKVFINRVRLIIRRYGLSCHKERYFPANSVKIITGVAITPNGPRIPNSHRKKLHEAFGEVEKATTPKEKLRLARSLLGRATAAEQVEPSFRSDVVNAGKIVRIAISENEKAKSASRSASSKTLTAS